MLVACATSPNQTVRRIVNLAYAVSSTPKDEHPHPLRLGSSSPRLKQTDFASVV
jgi:hypothetical protein